MLNIQFGHNNQDISVDPDTKITLSKWFFVHRARKCMGATKKTESQLTLVAKLTIWNGIGATSIGHDYQDISVNPDNKITLSKMFFCSLEQLSTWISIGNGNQEYLSVDRDSKTTHIKMFS